MDSKAPCQGAFHIASLDGMRTAAILIVFFSHAGLPHVVPGLFGVTVSFFLSGYLITTLLRMECERHGSANLRQFFLRRTLRILPPFYLILAVGKITPWMPRAFGAVTGFGCCCRPVSCCCWSHSSSAASLFAKHGVTPFKDLP